MKQDRPKDRRQWHWILLFALLFALTALYLPKAVDSVLPSLYEEKTVWELPEDAVCLYPEGDMDTDGYVVKGNCLIPVDSDPHLGFALEDEALACLLIDLERPVQKRTKVDVYYAKEAGGVSEDNVIKSKLKAKESQLIVELPPDRYGYIRVDINGEVRLKGIYHSNSAFIERSITLPLSAKRVALVYTACGLFCAAMLLSTGMVLLNRSNKARRSPYVIAALARVWLGSLAGVWYPEGQACDDALMFHYSNLTSYLSGREVPDRDVMLKELGMPVVLNIVNATGISYTVFLSLLWVLAGALTVFLVRRIGHRRQPKIEFLAFAFVLFQPIALEQWTGTRLYRNALLTPMYFLVFLIALIILFDLIRGNARRTREALLCSIPLGIVLSLTYLIKEDGLWLLLSVCALAVMMVGVCIHNAIKGRLARGGGVRAFFAICIPFVVFFIAMTGIRQINYNAFGVYETNARTSGEEGRFVTYVYKTASDDRTLDVWAPVDAIEKVFKASETLAENEALKQAVYTTSWQSGSIEQNPIKGDFLTWIMKDALFDSGTCTSKQEAEAYMGRVNGELRAAFKDGSLEADRRFRLISSLGGVSNDEIPLLLKETMNGYKNLLSTGIYQPGGTVQSNNKDDTQYASILTNQDLNTVNSEDAVKYRKYEVAVANGIIRVVFSIYNYLQPLLLALGLAGAVVAIRNIIITIKRRTVDIARLMNALLALFFLALSFVYLFTVSWFSHFLHNEYFSYFYSVGGLPLIVLFDITGFAALKDSIDNRTSRQCRQF